MSAAPTVHPDIATLAFLLGSWSGEGSGEYPTIPPFRYVETISFGHVGKPFLTYIQRTADAVDGRPLHAEMGYLRLPGAGRLELVVAHPTGITEIAEGTIEGSNGVERIKLRSTSVGRSASAKDVTAIERTLLFDGNEAAPVMRYTLRMAAVGQPLQYHLAAELRRVPAS